MIVAGVVGYGEEDGGLRELTRVWSKKLPDLIRRRITTWRPNEDEGVEKLKSLKDRLVEVRIIGMARPSLAGLSKKTPDLLEIKVGGEVEKALEYALSRLGGEVRVGEVFKPGDLIDLSLIHISEPTRPY